MLIESQNSRRIKQKKGFLGSNLIFNQSTTHTQKTVRFYMLLSFFWSFLFVDVTIKFYLVE